MAKLVSRTYGDALFELALEEKKIDELLKEAKFVRDTFLANEELIKVLHHPEVKKEEKLTFIQNVFKDFVSDEMQGFMHMVIVKDRYSDIISILEYFIHTVKEYKGIGSAKVTSAVELQEAQKNAIEEKLLATTRYTGFEISYEVDASILGGLIIRIEDKVVDSSLKTQLDKLKTQLSNIQLS